MPRSLFDPASLDASIRKLSSARGFAFTYLYRYLLNPTQIQSIAPTPGKAWALKNLRSDLSTWRASLSQVPAERLLTISWMGLLVLTRDDLIPLSDEARIATLFEDLRLFTTQLKADGLHIGSYTAFGGILGAEPAFTNAPQNAPAPLAREDEHSQEERRHELEDKLRRLRREETTLSTRARIPAMANEKLFADLTSIKEQIQTIEKELQS